MSACNIICQGRAGHLLTDAAYTNDDRTVAGFSSKVLKLPDLRMAIATRGPIYATTDLAREIVAAAPRSAEDLIARLPEMLCVALEIERLAYPAMTEWSSLVYAVYFCRRRSRAAGVLLASDNANMPASYQPFALQPVLHSFGPGVNLGAAVGRDVDPCDPASFNVAVDGLAAMEAQRRDPKASIGGFAELTTVTAQSVTTRTIRSWPDRVGERIAA